MQQSFLVHTSTKPMVHSESRTDPGKFPSRQALSIPKTYPQFYPHMNQSTLDSVDKSTLHAQVSRRFAKQSLVCAVRHNIKVRCSAHQGCRKPRELARRQCSKSFSLASRRHDIYHPRHCPARDFPNSASCTDAP